MVALSHWVGFLFFLKTTAEVLAPLSDVVFRRFLRLSSFPVCWRAVNVTPFPKGPPSPSVSNYRLISVTPTVILSKVFERLVSVRLGHFMECRGVLPTTQFAYRKVLTTCGGLLCVAHTLQSALEMGQEARIVQIDFSASFNRGQPSGDYLQALFCGNWRFSASAVCSDTVSL